MEHFSNVIKRETIDLWKEYKRLYYLFYEEKGLGDQRTTLFDFVTSNFSYLPFVDTCIDFEDFNRTYGYNYDVFPESVDVEKLVSFCEYLYNLVIYAKTALNVAIYSVNYYPTGLNFIHRFLLQVCKVMDKFGYIPTLRDEITIFVEKDVAADAVSSIVDEDLSSIIHAYKHQSTKGDINRKQSYLLSIYHKLCANNNTLMKIDHALYNEISFLFNNFNLRHNNKDKTSKDYKEYTANLSENEIEELYDDLYNLCLLAYIELDNVERIEKIKKLKQHF